MQLLDGESVTIDDAEHARSVLLRLTARCASIVDEIRKAIALKDPEGHQTADWATLQSEEVRTPHNSMQVKHTCLYPHTFRLVSVS
ncbi:hypothetical protein EON66_08440 [archaeon]|nr:MAG: hypothetical protein EON66_08440 [archaeon]